MKKTTVLNYLFLSLFMAFLFAACSKDDDVPENPDNPGDTLPSPPENIYQTSLINPALQELQDFYEKGYDAISGNVKLDNIEGLRNLLALSNVKKIDGYLKIQNNNDLLSFDGLSKLYFVGDDLIIYNNKSLENIGSISSLQSIGEILKLKITTHYNLLTDLIH
jgi:hypothetical protein